MRPASLPTVASVEPPPVAWAQRIAYDASNQPEYIGWALSSQMSPTVVTAGVGFTSITDASNTATVAWTAHGLKTGNRVVVSGATVDTDLNGTYIITVTGADAFTFTTASVSDAAYTEATLTITTYAPREGDSVWAIQKNVYSTSYVTSIHYAEGTTAPIHSWTGRAALAYS